MKNLIIIISMLALTSCAKEGHIYRASHRLLCNGHITTDFFAYPEKDLDKASAWYTWKQSDNMQKHPEIYSNMLPSETILIEYWCTEREWRHK